MNAVLLVDDSIVNSGLPRCWLIAPITVIPLPLFLPNGYLIGSSFGVQVFRFRNHKLKDASSK